MREGNSVLIVSVGDGNNLTLKKALNDEGIRVQDVNRCAEAPQILSGLADPDIVFSYTALPHGARTDISALAMEEDRNVTVLVVSRVEDINPDINAIEKGVADFNVPPFYHQEISRFLSCATRKETAVQKPGFA